MHVSKLASTDLLVLHVKMTVLTSSHQRLVQFCRIGCSYVFARKYDLEMHQAHTNERLFHLLLVHNKANIVSAISRQAVMETLQG
eukprot:m.39619 g.39619  ORF g.39619 m.39619 type:complete len:85 (-) comp14739_c0_seq1:404-658(-)